MADLPKTSSGTRDNKTASAEAAPAKAPTPDNAKVEQTVEQKIETEFKAAEAKWSKEYNELRARHSAEAQQLEEKHAADRSQAQAQSANRRT